MKVHEPDLFDIGDKGIYQLWVKICAADLAQDSYSLDPAFALLVGSVGGNGIKTIGYSDNFGTQWNLVVFEPEGLAAAINFFMMILNIINDGCGNLKIP